MEQQPIGEASSGVYTYKHRCDKRVDIHEISVKKSRFRVLLSYIGVVFLLANVYQFLLSKESLCFGSVYSIAFGILVAKCLQYKPVKKESVVIMPAFGVQLEIHFWRYTGSLSEIYSLLSYCYSTSYFIFSLAPGLLVGTVSYLFWSRMPVPLFTSVASQNRMATLTVEYVHTPNIQASTDPKLSRSIILGTYLLPSRVVADRGCRWLVPPS